MSAYRHLAPAEREHINSVRTGAQQCLSMEPTAPVRRRRNTTTGTRLAGARATPCATTSPSGMSCQSARQERIGGREADTVAGVVGCCLQWKKPYEEYFEEVLHLD